MLSGTSSHMCTTGTNVNNKFGRTAVPEKESDFLFCILAIFVEVAVTCAFGGGSCIGVVSCFASSLKFLSLDVSVCAFALETLCVALNTFGCVWALHPAFHVVSPKMCRHT